MYFRAGGKLSPEFVALLSQQTGFYLYKYPASYGSCFSPTMQESPVRVGENHKAIALSRFERPASRSRQSSLPHQKVFSKEACILPFFENEKYGKDDEGKADKVIPFELLFKV